MNRSFRALVALAIAGTACHSESVRPTAAASSAGSNDEESYVCFSATAEDNSESTTRLFDERGLQGGGYTWSPLLEGFAARHATLLGAYDGDPSALPGFGGATSVRFEGRTTWLVVDEEGDAAIVCSEARGLIDAIRAEHARANQNEDVLAGWIVQAGEIE